jgi:hypothetical protein
MAQPSLRFDFAGVAPHLYAGMLATVASLLWLTAALLLTLAIGGFVVLRRRGVDLWLPAYVRARSRRRPPEAGKPVHVILCIADHWEPQHGRVPAEQSIERVEFWVRQYPAVLGHFRDADGRPPRHTFFFPIDEYDPAHVDGLAGLCRQGFGEVEIHHHHDNDTSDALRQRLLEFKRLFHERHGVLPVNRHTGEVRYGFVHGNWALDNSRPDGRWCGVNDELDALRETGCYADFTMPSAPSRTQTSTINSIYYAVDDARRPKSHDRGVAVGTAPRPANSLLLVQGPLLLNWRNRSRGLVPRIENANIQGNQAPTMARLDLWLRARVQVPTRPDWFFVKLHTHGATEANRAVVLGGAMVRFHEGLAKRAAADANFHFHYVTAREMYNQPHQGGRGGLDRERRRRAGLRVGVGCGGERDAGFDRDGSHAAMSVHQSLPRIAQVMPQTRTSVATR